MMACGPDACLFVNGRWQAVAYPTAVTAWPYVANLTVSGLTALSSYALYCYSEDASSPANTLPDRWAHACHHHIDDVISFSWYTVPRHCT